MEGQEIILFIILIGSMIAFLELEVSIDAFYIGKTQGQISGVPHGKNAIQRCIVYFSLISLYFAEVSFNSICWFIFSLSAWWIIFDIRINKKRDIFSMFYVGKTAFTDKAIRKIASIILVRPEATMILIKSLTFIITLVIAIKSKHLLYFFNF